MGISVNSIAWRFSPLSLVKRLLVPRGVRVYHPKVGMYRNLKLNIDLNSQTQIYLGLYEIETKRFLRKARERAHWFIDVGAGMGEQCLWFSASANCRKVIAVEPLPASLAVFEKNLAANDASLADKIHIVTRFAGRASQNGMIRLDELDLDRDSQGLLKIDVDGYEMEVLRGSWDLLKGGKVDVLIETHSAELEEQCVDFLAALGYKPVIIKNAWWRFLLPERRPIAHNRWLWASAAEREHTVGAPVHGASEASYAPGAAPQSRPALARERLGAQPGEAAAVLPASGASNS